MLATFVTFTACKDYDDDIKTLETKLESLSSTVAEMQQKIEGGAIITSVTTTANTVIIRLSDGKSYTITSGANGKDGSLVSIGENGNWLIDGDDTGKPSKGDDGIYYTPGEDGFWHKVDGESVTPTTDSWMIEGTITAKWENGYVVLYNVEGSDGPITLGLVGMNNLVLIPDFVTDGGNPAPVLNFSSLVTPCGEIAPATALVRYQVSPTNASESLIDKEKLYFKYNTPQVLTRSAELNPKAEFVSLKNGVLTVRASIDTEVLEEIEDEGKITQLMLIVPITSGDEIVSDWGTVVSTPVEDISLVRVPAEVEGIDWSEYKLVETLDEAKALAVTSPTVVDIEFGKTVNLLDVVKTMFSEDSPWRDFDIDGYNLEYAFDLKDEAGEDIVYDHQQFLKLEGSVVSAAVVEGPEVRTPIVHVTLKAKDEAHECNVLEGFIKINIIGEPVEEPIIPEGLALVRVPADMEGVVWSDYKLVETLDEAKALEVADLTVVSLEHDQTLDLLEVVKTMLSEETPWSDFDIDEFNLVYAFDLKDEAGNDIAYDQQQFLNLAGSVVSATVVDGPAVRTPIVHVMLKSADEATVVEGFIKINIVGIEVEPTLPGLVGEWLFDDADPLKATVGNDLVLVGTHEVIEGITPEDGAIRIGAGSHYIVDHGIAPAQGHARVNEYSLVFDFMVDAIDGYKSFYQTDPNNGDDSEAFIHNTNGSIGTSWTNYSRKPVTPGVWERLVISVKNDEHFILYLEGKEVLTGNVQAIDDGRWSLLPTLLLFADNDGEDGLINISRVSLYDKALTAAEAEELGAISAIPGDDDDEPARDISQMLVGHWEFNDIDDLLKATVGKNLKLDGSHEAVEGPTADNKAVKIGLGSYYTVEHGLIPADGHEFVNEFSLVFDFKVDATGGSYRNFIQTDPTNTDDGELFFHLIADKSAGKIGTATTGYSAQVTTGEWHRLVLSVKNPSHFALYCDGEEIHFSLSSGIDSRWALRDVLLLFADDDGDDDDINVAAVALYDTALNAAEAKLLGGVNQ